MPSVTETMSAMLPVLVGRGRWWPLVDRAMLVVSMITQVGFLGAFLVNLDRGSMDRAAVALFFFSGFFCIDFGLWTSGVRYAKLERSLAPLIEVGRRIEGVASRGPLGSRRLERLDRVMRPLTTVVHWQARSVSIILVIMFVVKGHHIVPSWPEGHGIRDAWENFVVLVHVVIIAYGGRIFLVACCLHWMSSLCMDCALHILADQAAGANCWDDLAPTVRLHQQLQSSFRNVQAYFADDLSVVVRLMLFFGLIGALRVAFGVQDVNNVVILAIVYSYVAMVCLAGELQEVAGDEFHRVVCQCPWDTWPAAQRTNLHLFLAHTIKPTQVRFRYFGAMRLDTLSTIFNNMFKYTQVLRAGFGSGKWTE